MSLTRMQLKSPVRLSEFGRVSEPKGHGFYNGRMSLSEFARRVSVENTSKATDEEATYKPYIRNHYKRRRACLSGQTLDH